MLYQAKLDRKDDVAFFEVSGKWKIESNTISIDNSSSEKLAHIIENSEVHNAHVSFNILFSAFLCDSYRGAGATILTIDEHNYIWVGMGGGKGKVVLGVTYLDGNTIRSNILKSVGSSNDIELNRTYSIKAMLNYDKSIDIYVDGGKAFSCKINGDEIGINIIDAVSRKLGRIGAYCDKGNSAIFTNFIISSQRWPVFVLTPYDNGNTGHHFSLLYERIITPACEEAGFGKPFREIDRNKTGSVIEDIVDNIDKADTLIVVLTGNNNNVSFELGYAIAKHKNVVILRSSSETENVPFNFRDRRIIFYSIESPSSAILDIRGALNAVASNKFI